MSERRNRDDGPLMLQAFYSLATLARAGAVDSHVLSRLLQASGVEFMRSGRAVLVPLSEIKARIPNLWRSLVQIERTRLALLGGGNGQ